ncbi:hypothetical protein [Streptomyces cellostaticus]|nr:hypothetical protein [Streptomyces cellostaticus]
MPTDDKHVMNGLIFTGLQVTQRGSPSGAGHHGEYTCPAAAQ